MCNYLASTVSLSRAQPQCQITVHPQEACRLEAQAAGAKSQGFLKPHAHLGVGWGARIVPAGLRAGIRLPHGAQILFAGVSLCRGYSPTLGALIFKRKHGVPHPPVSSSAELEKASRPKNILSGSVENHRRIFSDCLLKTNLQGRYSGLQRLFLGSIILAAEDLALELNTLDVSGPGLGISCLLQSRVGSTGCAYER